jgi:YVTN family beta-propeller protein
MSNMPKHIIDIFRPTFHILIATAGRPCLKVMLDSLKDELLENDAITIVFDGENAFSTSTFSDDWLNNHKSKINIIKQIPNLGFYGHAIRNKYQEILSPKTTFIMNADDDDYYVTGTFNKLRTMCLHSDTLYIAKMYKKSNNSIIPYRLGKIIRHIPITVDSRIDKYRGLLPFGIELSKDGSTLYVANAGDNSVSVINTKERKVVEVLDAAIYPNSLVGSVTNGLALSEDEKTLFIANADNNCVAVFDVNIKGKSISKGFIPVGWYPTSVRVIGKNYLLQTEKGLPLLQTQKDHNQFLLQLNLNLILVKILEGNILEI